MKKGIKMKKIKFCPNCGTSLSENVENFCSICGMKIENKTRKQDGLIEPPKSEKKELAQVFQAFRIEVNGEMEALKRFLNATAKVICPGGRLAVITYHSIEDRMVKNFMKTGNIEGKEEKDFFGRTSSPWKQITRSPIVPSEEEIERNPRSRSAKLRIAELITPENRNR